MILPGFPVSADVQAARFTEPRLRVRLPLILADLEGHLGCSLPQACGDWAATQGAYRFLAHPQTAVDNLLPAFTLPAARAACRRDTVVDVHDSTSFNFTHLRAATGLGFLNDSDQAQGLHLHSSLLVDLSGQLLGLAHLNFWVREQFRDQSDQEVRRLPIEQKESFKWIEGLRATQEVLTATGQPAPQLIHVMDREGDIHEVFAEVKRLRHDAVIRCCQDRRVDTRPPDPSGYAKQQVARSEPRGPVKLQVPLKDGGYRAALVAVRSVRVRLCPSDKRGRGRQPLWLWLVEIQELARPPEGELAVRWWLWTTLRSKTLADVLAVLRVYRLRWRIEEYHRVLKTGCKVERLRLQSGERLMRAITLQAWVASRVVQLRDAAKQKPQASCRECFSDDEWQTLWAREHQRAWRAEEGEPTVQAVVKWLGKLGGHLGRNRDGLPGAEVLSRALYALTLLLEGRAIGRAEAAGPPSAGRPPPTEAETATPAVNPPDSPSPSHPPPHV
ncbi:MAG TPA: IS4 family transposase [Gemmataceae bacterium]|nr:IS4 family transposase [Gemmataceae bacterium]